MADTRQWRFYVIALAPDLHPNRVKFGISVSPESRLAQHAAAAPTAELLYTQEIPNPARVYEHLCILAGRGESFTRVGAEVYDVDDAGEAANRVHRFLGLMCNRNDEPSREWFEEQRHSALGFADYIWDLRYGEDAHLAWEVRDALLDILLVRWARPDVGPL